MTRLKGCLLPGARLGTITRLAALALAIAGCTPGLALGTATPSASSLGTRPHATVGATVDKAEIEGALDSAAAAGPASFKVLFSLSAEGYVQTLSMSEGVIDLATSRGRAMKEDFPGLAFSSKRELMLVGNRVFSRPTNQPAEWEESSGGARAFVGLDVPGGSALDVVRAALPRGAWIVIASASTDPPGSIRIRPVDADDVVVVIDAAGRLVSVVRSTSHGESGEGRDVHELTLMEFGVALELEAPP
jgi:hypothetical protein